MAEILDKAALKALSADTRQDIIKLLAKRPYTASELSKMLNKHVTTITEHLSVLEESGLIKKKESTNKWVYYTLADKGEKLLKPSYYSWVVVFALSAVFIFTGFLRMFSSQAGAPAMLKAAQSMEAAQNLGAAATQQTTGFDVVGTVLVIIGIIGFAYLAYKIRKR
jgi:DNA-binding transcriptional ArsR family regulator